MTSEDLNQANLVEKAMSAFRWVAGLRFMGQMISWLSTIFVIRFLAPEDYGVLSLAEVFRTFLVLFSTVGISQGLMKVENLPQPLIQKTLGLLVIVNSALFLLQFFLAPYAARFYHNDDLEMVLKVLAFTYLVIPWTSVPSSLVARNLDHKRTSKITFVTDVLASCLSLTMAYLGFGYWSLVAAIVFTALFNCFRFNRIIDYPKLPSFILKGTEELLKFGSFVALSILFFVAYNRVDVVIAGKYFDIAQVGSYGVALQLATMLMIKSVPLFNAVAFPAFARMNAATGDRNDYLITALGFASTIIFPIFLGVAMVSKEIIGLVLGSNWVHISGLFTIIVVSVPLRILAYVLSPAILAAGGARVDMINAFITLIFLTIAIFALLPFGLSGVGIAWSLTSVCVFVLTVVRGGHLLGIALKDILLSIYPALFVSLLMCAVIYAVGLSLSNVSGLGALYKIPLGGFVYALVFWCFFRGRSEELIRILMRLMGRQ